MCFLVFFLALPLYHVPKWLATILEVKGYEGLLPRIVFTILYLIGWFGGFGVGLLGKQENVLGGVMGAFMACLILCILAFGIAGLLPDRRKQGRIYSGPDPDKVPDDLDRFRKARRRAAREKRELEQRRREEDERKRQGRDQPERPRYRPVQRLPEVRPDDE